MFMGRPRLRSESFTTGYNSSFQLFSQGQASDIAIQAKEILKMRDAINQLYVKHCNQEIKNVGMWSLYFVQLWGHSSIACPGFVFIYFFSLGGLVAKIGTHDRVLPISVHAMQRRPWSETRSCPPMKQ
jgi:hypothetical protein